MDRFPTVLRGYRRDEVDAVMARVDGTLGRDSLTAPPITPQELGRTRFGVELRGYDRAAVNQAMIDAAAALGAALGPLPGYGTSPSPPAGFGDGPGPAAPPGYEPTSGPAAPSGPPTPSGDGASFNPELGSEPPQAARDRMVARLRDPRLETTPLGPGYDRTEVDHFLDYAVNKLTGEGEPLTAREVHRAEFTSTRFRGGYSEKAVDDLLDELIAYVDVYGSR